MPERDKTALIVVDVQEGFVKDSYGQDLALERIKELLVDDKFDYRIATKFVNSTASSLYIHHGYKGLMRGDKETAFIQGIEDSVDKVIEKDCYGLSIDNLKLIKGILKSSGITTVVVCGFLF